MDPALCTALVTGANRGFGRALAAEPLARGATVYAAACDIRSVDLPDIARITVDGLVAGSAEIAAEEVGRRVQAGLAGGVTALYPALS